MHPGQQHSIMQPWGVMTNDECISRSGNFSSITTAIPTFMPKSPMPHVTHGTGRPRNAMETNRDESTAEAIVVETSGAIHHDRVALDQPFAVF